MRCPHCDSKLTKKNRFCPERGEEVILNKRKSSQATPRGIHALIILGVLLLVVIVAAGVLVVVGGPENLKNVITGKESIRDIEEVKDSVVMIEVYDTSGDLFATGSGFCVYKKNWIATNFYVIEGAKSIKVITDSHQELYVDNIVFFNKERDIAVLSIKGSLKPLELGDGSSIKIKDSITAIGSPKGELNTVSEGIISNVDDKDRIRISAPISHGSSGGVLLNQENEVIGITNAGYDDAQNLNFAINISILENLYDQFKSNETIRLDEYSLSNQAGSLNDFDNYLQTSNACYMVPTIDLFHYLTDCQTRFERLLEDEDYSWFCIYDSLSQNDKETVISLFIELNEYEFDGNSVDGNIENWDVTDFFICLGVLNRYQYAIAVVDVGNYADEDALFDNVDNNYPLEAAEKSLILYLIGQYDWSEIHKDNKEDIFDYFDVRYGTSDLGAILEVLGYEVEYENDGTLTAYW